MLVVHEHLTNTIPIGTTAQMGPVIIITSLSLTLIIDKTLMRRIVLRR